MRRLLERDVEVERLTGLLDRLHTDGGGQAVISGVLGAGKTALLSAAAAAAAERGLLVLDARGDEQERTYRFGGALNLFGARADARRGRRHIGIAIDAVPMPVPIDGNATASDGEFGVLHRLFVWIRNLSAQRGVVVLVDDVEWLDEETLRFLGYLQARIADMPVAVIATTGCEGPYDPPAALDRLLRSSPRQLSVPLKTLSLDAAAALATIHGWEPDEQCETVEDLWRTTGGNPLLLDALLASRYPLEGSVPERIRHRLARCFERLGAASRELASAVAILGDGLPLPIVAEVALLPDDVAATAADRLVGAGVLVAADPPRFGYPILSSAARDVLKPGQGPRLHSAAARSLHARGYESAAIAPHLLGGPCEPEPWAQEVLIEAADIAGTNGEPGVASRYMSRAIEIHGPTQPRTDVLVRLGLLEAAAGETTSISRLRRALDLARAPEERTVVLSALGRTLYLYGRHEEAADAFADAIRSSAGRPEVALEMEADYMCAMYWLFHDREPAMQHLGKLVAALSPDQSLNGPHRSLLAVFAVYGAMTLGPSDIYAQMALRAWGQGELLRVNGPDCLALEHTIMALLACGRTAVADQCAQTAVTGARRSGSGLAIAEALSLSAIVARARGDVLAAADSAEAAVAAIRRGWRVTMPVPYAILAECRVEQGDLNAAEQLLNMVAEWPSDTPDTRLNSWFYWSRGQLRSARGDAAGAVDDFLRIGSRAHESHLVTPSPVLGPWSSMAGVAACAAGDRTLARQLVEDDLQTAHRFGRPDLLGAVMRAEAITRGARGNLEEAIAVLEQADAPLELAKALLDQGRVLRRAGRRIDARQPLSRSLDLARRAGATAVANNAHLELIASGARPRRSALTGPASLTPSEERVARLAAAGNANRTIAETLVVSQNTVEWHLRHVFQKLGVNAREQLAPLLAEVSDTMDELHVRH